MKQKEKELIIEKLRETINDANNRDEIEVAFAFENFKQWFYENFGL